jgi:hypothetical protein
MDRRELPSDRSEARRISRMAKSFTLVDGELYKCAASGILQRCIPIPQGCELLCNIHTGVLLTVKFRQPIHEFTFRVGMSFIPYPLVLTLVV